ncbi:MAG: Hpt domain-containing protein [Bacteroidales bacterium]|nr:Hpt domain-containing protein [Bacteroidales bacterium]
MKKDQITDLSYLNEISAGNKKFIIELIDMFFQQVLEYQELLQILYEEKNWLALAKVAHKAKSSVIMVGLKKLGSKLKMLEEKAKEGKDIESYKEIIAKFVNDSNLAIKELKEVQTEIIQNIN